MTHYIIDFVNGVADSDINEYLSACGATVLKTFDAFEKVLLVESESVPPITPLIESVIDDTDHTNHIKLLTTIPIQAPVLPTEGSKTINVSDQKDWWKVYSGSVVDLDATSFQLPLSGAGSIVYLVDSGIKLDHPEFEDADIECLYSLNDDFIDRKGHGTALASVIVGKTCGITNAKLKVVKLFDADVPTRLSDFLSAMDSIYNDFATNTSYGIMNCSWATARNEYIEAKMQTLFLAGIQIVVASGNDGSDIGDVTPAAMPEAIVVGAYNSSLLPCDFSDFTGTSAISVTSGSTNGGKLSGWAPGEDIYAATLDGGYGFSSGTSLSAAIHSAIIAYNMSLPPYQFDDDVNAIWNNATRNNVSFMSKRGLLILDDPKYQNSPNLVSMLVTDMLDPYNNRGTNPQLFAAIFAGAPFRITLFNPMSVSSITLHDPLPNGISINNHGIMSGYVESVEEYMEEHRCSLSVTDLDGNTSDGDLGIKVLKMLPQHTRASYDVNTIIPYELNLNNCFLGANPVDQSCSGDIFVCQTLTCTNPEFCSCVFGKSTTECLCITNSFPVNITNHTVSASRTSYGDGPSDAISNLTLSSTGVLSMFGSVMWLPGYSVEGSILVDGVEYFAPNEAGSTSGVIPVLNEWLQSGYGTPSLFSVRATYISGSTPNGTTRILNGTFGSWQSLASTVEWEVLASSTSGDNTNTMNVTFTLAIALSSDLFNVLGAATITLNSTATTFGGSPP